MWTPSSASRTRRQLSTAVGYSIVQINPELREVRVDTGLTDDVVLSRVSAGGFAPPLYIHESVKTIAPTSAAKGGAGAPGTAFVSSLRQSLSVGRGGIVTFGSGATADTTTAFLQHICSDLGMPPPRLREKEAFTAERDQSSTSDPRDPGGFSSWQLIHGSPQRDRLSPLHVSAASQLGLIPTTGIPRLVTAMLPRSGQHVPAPCTHWVESMLKVPPSYADARKISAALHSLRTLELAWPQTIPMSESRIAKLLRERETNHYFYREVRDMLIRAGAALGSHPVTGAPSAAGAAAQLALEVAASTAGITAVVPDGGMVSERAAYVANRIGAVVLCDGESNASTAGGTCSRAPEGANRTLSVTEVDTINKLFTKMEKWRGRTRPEMTPDELAVVAEKAQALCAAVVADFGPILAANKAGSAKQAQLVCEWRDDSLWLKGPRVDKVGATVGVDVMHPKDRWGRSASGHWSTPRVEAALAEYKYAVHDAQAQSIQVLRNLAAEISDPEGDLLHNVLLSAYFSLVFRSLTEHARASLDAGWSLPELVGGTVHREGSPRLKYRGAWPYWIDERDAVQNDINLNGMTLLTGPNMAGKSTVNRVVGSVALLANCGFAAPCEAASIAEVDNICVRMTNTDSPVEGKSGFAMEMYEIRSLLRDATDKSLVLVDELGRGTEYRAGTALSAAVLESLAQSGCAGLFATHLHAILDLNLAADRPIARAAMEVKEVQGRLVSTHKYEEGTSSRESLAFVVAQDHGIPATILARAQRLLSEIPAAGVAVGAVDDAPPPSATSLEPSTPLEGGICHHVLPELADVEAFVVEALDAQIPGANIQDATPLIIDQTQAPPAVCARRSMVYVLRSPLGTCNLVVGGTLSCF